MAPSVSSLDDRRPQRQWCDYVVGVVDQLVRRGLSLEGFEAHVTSDIPVGAGLASSAALMVATARALRKVFGIGVGDLEIAEIAHDAEFSFVGARVGQMDQLVCSLGRDGEALFIDTRDLATRPVPLNRTEMDIVVVDSGVRHQHATGGYNLRRAECEEAASRLGVASLRDVPSVADLADLPPTLSQRARHVLTENARVTAAVDALARGDARALGAIVNAGHESLRDDFEVSIPIIDDIVAAAQADPDVLGARLTGGGFGGSLLILAARGAGRAAAERAIERAGSASARVIVAPSREGSPAARA